MSTPDPNLQPITIYSVSGGTIEQQQALMGCAFNPKNVDTYFFVDKEGKEKSTAPSGRMSTGKNFTFVMDGLIWTIHHFKLDLADPMKPKASGKWRVAATMEHIGPDPDKPGDIEEDP